jgi:hypothetical protein
MTLEALLAGPMVQTIFVRLESICGGCMAMADPYDDRVQVTDQSRSGSIGASSYFSRPIVA